MPSNYGCWGAPHLLANGLNWATPPLALTWGTLCSGTDLEEGRGPTALAAAKGTHGVP